MAIGTPVSRGNASGTTTATTSSFTPGAGDNLYALVFGRRSTQVSVQPTISDSLGGTWEELADVSLDTGSNPRLRGRWFVQEAASGSAMTVTGTISDGTTCGVMVVSVSGVGTDHSNIITGTNTAGDPSLTLPNTPAASSGVLGMVFSTATNLFTPGAGLTELTEFTANSAMQGETCYDITSPGTGVSWTSTNTLSIGFAIELKEPSGGGETGTLSSTLDAVTLSATGALPISGTSSATLGAVTLSASGNLPISGVLSSTLGDVALSAAGGQGNTGSASITLGSITIAATGSLPISGTLAATLAPVTLSAIDAAPSSAPMKSSSPSIAIGICL